MNANEAICVPVCIGDNILAEIEETYDQVTKRAYEIFLERGGICTMDLDDWLQAEQEMLFKPHVPVEDAARRITVTICIGELSPLDLQLLITPNALVVQAEAEDSPTAKKVFRTVEFPRLIDVRRVEARCANGYLVVTA
jgi:HSP20 family molecular chaperone IbpA